MLGAEGRARPDQGGLSPPKEVDGLSRQVDWMV